MSAGVGASTAGRDRRLRLLAVATAVAALVLVAAALALHASYIRRGVDVPAPHAGDLVLATLFPVAGALVLWRQPRNAAGWVLLSATLVAVSVLAHEWAYDGGVADPGSLPLVGLAVWLSSWTYVPYWLQTTLLPLLFPDGRLPSRRWKGYLRVVLALFAVHTFAGMFKPDDDVEGFGLSNPLGVDVPGIPIEVWAAVQFGTTMLLWFGMSPVALFGMLHRMRSAAGRERAQLQWLLLGISTAPVLGLLSFVVPAIDAEVVFALSFTCIPLSLGVAVLRHRMFDVELVVHRTIVYGLLTAASVLAYLAIIATAGPYIGADGSGPFIAAAVVAVAASVRTRFQRLVERRVFGARRDPYALVRQVSQSTGAADAPDQALAALVVTLRSALHLPFVQVLDSDGRAVAEAGEPVAGTHVLPVVDGGRRLGVLVVGRRSRRERLRTADESALLEIARRAGSLLSARQLNADLQTSYAQLILVREEERRRLHRDLHDGVGPALAGMALQLDSLAGRLSADPELVLKAERLRDRLQGTVGELRRLIEGLRPAAIDRLGLPAALQSLATDEGTLTVDVTTELPDDLPAGVQVATYLIAGEAVTNVVRHSRATSARVRADVVGQALHLVITDDGDGFSGGATEGVGLRSMHERAAEVGGALHVDSHEGAGTRVTALLPLQGR